MNNICRVFFVSFLGLGVGLSTPLGVAWPVFAGRFFLCYALYLALDAICEAIKEKK